MTDRRLRLGMLLLALAAAPLRAQDGRAAPESWLHVDASQKVEGGTGHYWDSDTNLLIGLPQGFNATAEFNGYRSDTSSFTPIVTFGAGKDWEDFSLSATYALQTRANGFESNTFDARAVMRSRSKDYRTTLGADVAVTHSTQFLAPLPASFDITQWQPTISLKQKIKQLRLTADLSVYSYNKDILLITAFLVTHPQLNNFVQVTGLNGLVSGFPNWSAKYGAYYDFESFPVTTWATYQNFQLLDTFFGSHQTIDSETYGIDYDFNKTFTATGQYNHLRQTGQPVQDLYALTLNARF